MGRRLEDRKHGVEGVEVVQPVVPPGPPELTGHIPSRDPAALREVLRPLQPPPVVLDQLVDPRVHARRDRPRAPAAELRTGNPVTGWAGHPQDTTTDRFRSTVRGSEVVSGRLVLTLSWSAGSPPDSGPVTLHPAPPSPFSQRNGRARYRRLYGARRSWLTTGRTPVASRRDVPLEVLVAGAEDD